MNKTELLVIAELAALALTEGQEEAFAADLTRRLEGLTLLEAVDLPRGPDEEGWPCPEGGPREDKDPSLREDRAIPFEDPESLLDRAPRREGRFFQIPNLL